MKATLKQKRDGHWVELDRPEGTPTEILIGYDGTETVIEVNTGKAVIYYCGTAALVTMMLKKGVALLCQDAALMYKIGAQDLIYKVAEVFAPKADKAAVGAESSPSLARMEQQQELW